MPRTGRPPLTEDVIRERIAHYRERYAVKELNADGFPVYPAGMRETRQHREWIVLFKALSRVRARAGTPPRSDVSGHSDGSCPICLRPVAGPATGHQRCQDVVTYVQELGPPVLDRIRTAVFPDQAGPVRGRRPRRP